MENLIKNKNYHKVTEIILNLGIKPKMLGFDYLRYAVILQTANESLKLSEIYDQIATVYNTKPHSVERGIRNAITSAHNSGGLLSINDYYDNIIYNNGNKYTNSELISMIAEIVNLEILKNDYDTV